MSPADFQEYMHSYATHFDLLKHCVLNANVRNVRRDSTDTKWLLDIEPADTSSSSEPKTETVSYDKVAFCHGYQTQAKGPKYEGEELFAGSIIHSQAYRDPENYRDKTVVVVGLCSTTGDIVP